MTASTTSRSRRCAPRLPRWGLDLRRGWEVFPSQVAGNDLDDLVLAGTRSILIEFPGSWLDLEDPIALVVEAAEEVEAAGLVPVLAHPERCRAVADDPESVRPLAERGWILCLNAPSLVGAHGATAERTSWALLDAGLVTLAASDGHSVARPPKLDVAYRAVRDRLRRRDRTAAVRRQRASLELASRAAASRPGARPPSSSSAFAREKWRQPKKPLLAE